MDETILVILPGIGRITIREAQAKGLLDLPHNRNYGKSSSLLGKTYEEIHGVKGAEEKREKQSKAMKGRKHTTEARAKMGKSWTLEHHANLSKSSIECWAKPGTREEHGRKIKKSFEEHPEYGESDSKGQIKYWSNLTPEEKENQLRNRLFKGSRCPNLSEKKLIPMLKPLGFYFNGNGPFSIGGKTPDYVHKTLPLLIEYDGYAGHNPKHPWVPDNKPQLDDQRDINYHKAGYDVLRLLPEDLWEGKEHVQNKAKEWMETKEKLVVPLLYNQKSGNRAG